MKKQLPAIEAFLKTRPTCIAHRGGSGIAPENTLAAFEKAIRIGAPWAELDVRASRRGALVVIHDRSLERTTNGSGQVSDFTLKELQSLNAGSHFSPKFAGERIPAFNEVLKAARGRLRLLVEIKEEGIEEAVASALRKSRMSDDCIVISFSPRVLYRMRSIAKDIATGLILKLDKPVPPSPLILRARRVGGSMISPSKEGVTRKFVEAAHSKDVPIITWTVNEAARMRELLATDVDGITTDRPDILLNLLREEHK